MKLAKYECVKYLNACVLSPATEGARKRKQNAPTIRHETPAKAKTGVIAFQDAGNSIEAFS